MFSIDSYEERGKRKMDNILSKMGKNSVKKKKYKERIEYYKEVGINE